MKQPLVLTGHRNRLYVNSRYLVLDNPEEEWGSKTFEPHDLPFDVVIIDGRAHGAVTIEALRCLSSDGVPVHLLNCAGRTLGSFLPGGPSHGKVKLAQYRAALDPERRLTVAKAFIQDVRS